MIPITASSPDSVPATLTITSTFATKCWGPIALCVGSFLPFSVTYYLNGHHFIERELERAGVPFRKHETAGCTAEVPLSGQQDLNAGR